MIKICICDDENEICLNLKKRIENYTAVPGSEAEIKAYTDSTLLSDELEHGAGFDIYILDMLMPIVSGMELARQVRKAAPFAPIVFLTSSPEFALESYEVHASDYLLKPVSDERLHAVLDALFATIKKQNEPYVMLKSGRSIRSVAYSSIVYLEAFHNNTAVYLNTGDSVDNARSMGEMEKLFEARDEFLRVHRSYIVNMSYIRELRGNYLFLAPSFQVPISRNLQSSVRTSYFDYMEKLF